MDMYLTFRKGSKLRQKTLALLSRVIGKICTPVSGRMVGETLYFSKIDIQLYNITSK